MKRPRALILFALVCAVGACSGSGSSSDASDTASSTGDASDTDTDTDADTDADTDTDTDADTDADTGSASDTASDTESDSEPDTGSQSESDTVPEGQFVVVTFNTGTTGGMTHDEPGDVYGDTQAGYSDEYYGDGIAWIPAVEAAQAWFDTFAPDIVAFQEIFYSGNCPDVPAVAQTGFVCETWQPGDPTVAQVLVGDGYQVACHMGKDDKCLAVRAAFGTIRQCEDEDLCLDGLDGAEIDGCGGGSRVGRATVDLAQGGEITVVSYHGTSGALPDDADCRAAQVAHIFEDMDGEPAANGARNIVLGDLNIDPCRVPSFLDASSDAWNDEVGDGEDFHWVSPCGLLAEATYAGLLNIDHVASDTFDGECYAPGVTSGYDDVYPPAYFDHKPLVCTIGDL